MSWKMPLEDGGDLVTHYIVDRRETSRLNWVIMETECKTLSCVSSKLIKNNEYVFRVRGVNKFGPGVPLESDPVIARNAYSKHAFSGHVILIDAIHFFVLFKAQTLLNMFYFPLSLQLSHHNLEHQKSRL